MSFVKWGGRPTFGQSTLTPILASGGLISSKEEEHVHQY